MLLTKLVIFEYYSKVVKLNYEYELKVQTFSFNMSPHLTSGPKAYGQVCHQ